MSATAAAAPAPWEALAEGLGPLRLPYRYCPVEPTAKQEWFLRQDAREVFFGGAAGPGKSWGLLMAALQYVDMVGYHGLLLRPTLTEFEQPGGLIEVSHDWLGGTDAYWNGTERAWTFPSRASIRFGYLSHRGDIQRYKGPSYLFVGFDELTSFPEYLYRAIFRVLRRPRGLLEGVPVRMRAASNPGDVGHTWVKNRFIVPETRAKDAVLVRATIHDNPFLDYDDYLQSLAHLSPIDQERLIRGDWDVSEEGGKFQRQKFQIIDPFKVAPAKAMLRYWDLAGSIVTESNTDPDWTVGLKYEVDHQGLFTIRHIARMRSEDAEVQRAVRHHAEEDGRPCPVYIEKDPGQAGKSQVATYARTVLQGFACYGGDTKIAGKAAAKEVRARPVAAAVGNDLVRIVENCPNLIEFLDECSIFPNGTHDDCIDALSGAHNKITLSGAGSGNTRMPSVPQGRIPGVADRR